MQNEGNPSEKNQGALHFEDSSTIVIVHGAWSSANDWLATAEHFRAAGNKVIAMNLPGHGSDDTPASATSLQLYIYEVLKSVGAEKDLIFVCHSFGGIVVRAVAELIAPQIKKIIYVAAFVPQNGDSLLSIAQTDAQSLISKNLIVDEAAGIVGIVKEAIPEIFMADAPEPVAAYVTENLRPEPLAPLATPVNITGPVNINEIYIYTENDRAVSHSLQQRMVKNAGIIRTYTLPSSHTPFIGHSPVLSAIISFEAL
ncbi:Alpha/beta hydrolase family protein [Dyadobacter soli]|uniref:Alpha/beta hydrolase family protein n=1 Tax=Dyadobacter soli TaxID=659014 RepID=A0A1G7AB32_9BACT|nr:alpha/beta hydrolase [Dyadobacter soli]SDE11883.1 Alpha/beta hydrolase family protein [Dyadobacter soli]